MNWPLMTRILNLTFDAYWLMHNMQIMKKMYKMQNMQKMQSMQNMQKMQNM